MNQVNENPVYKMLAVINLYIDPEIPLDDKVDWQSVNRSIKEWNKNNPKERG